VVVAADTELANVQAFVKDKSEDGFKPLAMNQTAL
jgi:hypothetical protein